MQAVPVSWSQKLRITSQTRYSRSFQIRCQAMQKIMIRCHRTLPRFLVAAQGWVDLWNSRFILERIPPCLESSPKHAHVNPFGLESSWHSSWDKRLFDCSWLEIIAQVARDTNIVSMNDMTAARRVARRWHLESAWLSVHDMIPKCSRLKMNKFDLRPSTFDLRPSTFDLRPSKFEIRNSKFDTTDSLTGSPWAVKSTTRCHLSPSYLPAQLLASLAVR